MDLFRESWMYSGCVACISLVLALVRRYFFTALVSGHGYRNAADLVG